MEKQRVIILACGSFNPPTFGHLRMLEDAKTSLESDGSQVLGGILSPVSDGYGKKTLINAIHRMAMTVAAVSGSDWIHSDGWECSKPEWTKTVDVIAHHQKEAEKRFGNDVRVLLLVGGDVVETFDKFNSDGTPVWSSDDLSEIVTSGLIVQPRPGSNLEKTLEAMNFEKR
uniref:CTP_transf_like domain-containing protein n=1 Tax=Caenorhabditis tropicalis TaxID=1561998 RepID=A0A1I7TZN2_9PELO